MLWQLLDRHPSQESHVLPQRHPAHQSLYSSHIFTLTYDQKLQLRDLILQNLNSSQCNLQSVSLGDSAVINESEFSVSANGTAVVSVKNAPVRDVQEHGKFFPCVAVCDQSVSVRIVHRYSPVGKGDAPSFHPS